MSPVDLYHDIRDSNKLVVIAGPCVLEDKSTVFDIAEFATRLTRNLPVTYIFKASFEKANRTSSKSYRGPGIEEGLKLLEKIKKEFEVPVLTDIHNEFQAAIVAEVVDVIQIPAFLSRQTALLEEAGRTGKIVNVKKAQFMAGEDIVLAAEKVAGTGNKKIMLTERGTSFGYHNLVVDMRNLIKMAQSGFPVIFDATHSVQLPSASGGKSGGQPEFISALAQAAVATGSLQGVFFEIHPNPEKALSDASSMLNLGKFADTLKRLIDINELIHEWEG